MKGLFKKWEGIFAAAAFAEAGEHDMAKEILREEERPRNEYHISPTTRPSNELRAPGIKR